MPLSADNRALLELILARGQSYEDLASLLDVSQEEVRSRARAALTELGGADPDRNVALTDWLLGQADPIGRADAARHVREDAMDQRLATQLVESLREIAPDGDFPKLPGAPPTRRFGRRAAPTPPTEADAPRAPSSREARKAGRLSSLTQHQTRLIVALGSGALILVFVVLAVTGVFGGGGDDSASDGSEASASAPSEDIQRVPLRPTSGGDARGSATFGIASGSQAFVELDISNLEPAPSGQAYVLWLLVSEDQGHPLTPFQVDQSGSYSEQIPIASFLTELAARTQFVDVSLSPRRPLLREVADAVDQGTPVIEYTGESILRGQVRATSNGGGGGQ